MNIEPIKLLKGSHSETAQTGQGCFMNVVSYLNGESQITDQSPCVCVTVRKLAIHMNDYATDEQRQKMLPFVLRAMGSATQDPDVLRSRTDRLREYGKECDELMQAFKAEQKKNNPRWYANAKANADAYAYANAYAYAYADAYAYAYANANADAYAYAYANANAKKAALTLKASLFDAGLRYLDAGLSPAEPANSVVIERMGKLVELQHG